MKTPFGALADRQEDRSANVLKLLTGPVIPVSVCVQSQLVVSHSAMTESEPPVARKRAVGCISAVRHDDVCPLSANSRVVPPLSSRSSTGARDGYARMRVRPSPVVTKTLVPLQQNAIWFVWTGCWCEEMGVVDAGERM